MQKIPSVSKLSGVTFTISIGDYRPQIYQIREEKTDDIYHYFCRTMYVPTPFREDDRETILDFMRQFPLGTLVANGQKLAGVHLPFVQEEKNGQLYLLSHLAEVNDISHQLANTEEVLVIFSGPSAYVSPFLYKQQQSVPTWNHVAVHVSATPFLVHTSEEKEIILKKMIDAFEAAYHTRWDELSSKYKEHMKNAITGLKLEVTDIQAAYKLSQDKPAETRQTIADHLLRSGEATENLVSKKMQEDAARSKT